MKMVVKTLCISLFILLTPFKVEGAEQCPPLKGIAGITKPGDPPIEFKKSDILRKVYGVRLGFFYGDWKWNTDFNIPGIKSTPFGNEAIAQYASRCYTSYPVGRIHYGILEKVPGESQDAYSKRIFDQVIAAKRELLILQQTFKDKLEQHMPEGVDAAYKAKYHENMQVHLMNAQLQIIQFVDTHLIYTIEGMGNYTRLQKQTADSVADILSFIVLIGDVPDADRWARDMLVQNTSNVLTTYGSFFGESEKAQLKKYLDESLNDDQGEDLEAVKQRLEAWVFALENALKNSFDENSPYFQIVV
jgi:hypothetical protein